MLKKKKRNKRHVFSGLEILLLGIYSYIYMCTKMDALTFINNVVFCQYIVSEESKALNSRLGRLLFVLTCGTQT